MPPASGTGFAHGYDAPAVESMFSDLYDCVCPTAPDNDHTSVDAEGRLGSTWISRHFLAYTSSS
jgi:hypothetical protein